MVETIDKLGGAWPTIRTQLVANYERERETFVADWVGLGNVTTVLQAAQARASQLPLEAVKQAWLFEGVRRTYRAGQRLMGDAYATADPHLFHEWRKQVKYLWHQHELLHEVWPALMGEAAEAFHVLSSLLGDAHDLVVLEQTVATMATSLPADEVADLLRHLRQRQRELETAARPLGQRLFAETPRAFAQRLAVYWQVRQAEMARHMDIF
jgi:CHAD domain-containing protein